MHTFARNLITEWRRLELPVSGETFVVAVSGGADSISLLLAVDDLLKRKKLELRFVIAHFNHNLRGAESLKDEEFVKHLAGDLGFELALGGAKMAGDGNLEQNARMSGTLFLQNRQKSTAYGVLTAHTMNDQAETFLMNLIRGSGIDGLSGMKSIRDLHDREMPTHSEGAIDLFEDLESGSSSPFLPFSIPGTKLVRPLLSWAKRADTENFCSENNVEYRYDTMNKDLAFQRVRIRKILLPMLADFNPNIVETLANTANLMRLECEQSGAVFDDSAEILKIGDLKTLAKADLYSILRRWLEKKRGNLRAVELKHIEALERLILSKKSGKTVELPGGETVVKHDGMLTFANIKVDK